ncbi:MAG: hypothetical protein J2P15_16850, partial [Micromonosporaceae bacterium]|nr:hypothetical protein [Micromonosporaceae bacterium]
GLAVLGALGVGYLWTHASGTAGWMYHGGFAIGALAVAAVLAHATVSPGSWTARLLAVPPLVWLGRISYGVYLWHWPLYQFVDAEHTGLAGPGLLLARIGLTLAVATVSYLALERPVLRRRWPRPATGRPAPHRAPREGTSRSASAPRESTPSPGNRRLKPAMATVAALGLTLATITLATAPSLTGSGSTAAVAPVIPPPLPAGSVHPSQQQPPMRRPGRRPGTQPRVTILGDSVAWTLGAYLPPHPGIQVDNKATQGCGIALLPEILELGQPATNYPYCDTWPSKYGAAVHADDPDVVVLLYDRWELMDRKLDGVYQHVGQAPFDAYLSGQLDRAVRIAAGRGALVVLLTAPYTHRAEAPSGGLYPEDQPSRVDAWNALVRKVAAAHPGNAMVLDLNRLVCPGGQFAWRVDGMRVRSDGLHFTPVGVQRLIAPWLLPRLATIAASGQP